MPADGKHANAIALLERNYDITFPTDAEADEAAVTVGGLADQVMAGLADRADG